jgi:hypothetical protein
MKYNDEFIENLVSLFKGPMSVQEIANKVGLPHRTSVYEILRLRRPALYLKRRRQGRKALNIRRVTKTGVSISRGTLKNAGINGSRFVEIKEGNGMVVILKKGLRSGQNLKSDL